MENVSFINMNNQLLIISNNSGGKNLKDSLIDEEE